MITIIIASRHHQHYQEPGNRLLSLSFSAAHSTNLTIYHGVIVPPSLLPSLLRIIKFSHFCLQGNTGTGFSITDEGFLNVASTLDAETTWFYSLEITATDRHSTQPLSGLAKVSITITGMDMLLLLQV